MSAHRTEQENFWAGEFGSDYVGRNKSDTLLASNVHLFSRILKSTRSVTNVLELGANIGMNLKALRVLIPQLRATGVEINQDAVTELGKLPDVTAVHGSILDYVAPSPFDLTFVKGVLIHINPQMLNQVYDTLFTASSRYVCVIEYYNPSPVTVTYRGHADRLFKRDFAGEMLERHSSLSLIDYGFAYRRDPNFPQDDLTWFLMESKGA